MTKIPTYYDAKNRPCEKQDAVRVELVTVDDKNQVIKIQYFGKPGFELPPEPSGRNSR